MPIEETEVFHLYRHLSNRIWRHVKRWDSFDRDTVGKQLVRAIDRVGATLVEGDGRFGDAESILFFRVARASAREARFWLTASSDRGLIEQAEVLEMVKELISATRQLNGLINYRIRHKATMVREVSEPYIYAAESEEDPFTVS